MRILPYARGQAPGNTQHAKQADIDTILAAYADRPGQTVTRAALLEVDDYRTGMDAGAHAFRLFQAKELIACAALSKRRLFRQHFDYCNYHTYTLIVQRYIPGQGDRFSFTSRRRDGGVRYLWASDRFAHQRPIHVSGQARIDLDKALVESLLKLPEDSLLREAIREFNAANTDSDDVPEHVEVVMVKSAFEWLYGIDEKAGNFWRAVEDHLSGLLGLPPPFEASPMGKRWRKRWQDAKRPLEAWAQDFCDVRGAAAHGKHKRQPRFVWQADRHLAFASIFFPLVLKKRLADDGLLTLDETDRGHIKHIEELLTVDPFGPEASDLAHRNAHPWAELYYELLFRKMAQHMERGMKLPEEDEGESAE